MLVLGVVFISLGVAAFFVSMVVGSRDQDAVLGAALLLLLFGIPITFIAGIHQSRQIANRKNAQRQAITRRATKDCNPYAVTHKHENGGYVVYSCANDNKIRVIKK